VAELLIPLFNCTVQAGFPSPADDYLDKAIDLNEHLEVHKSSVFMVRVEGDTFVTHGILDGAMLIVDKAEPPRQSCLIVCILDGEFHVGRYFTKNGSVELELGVDQPRLVTPTCDFEIWGVVKHAINKLL
tara:strand:- start:69 stop:458 length:390 start_codon:yes stop_codon:yes gene_type:complete